MAFFTSKNSDITSFIPQWYSNTKQSCQAKRISLDERSFLVLAWGCSWNINLKTPQSLIWFYNNSVLINQRHLWEKKILYLVLTVDRSISLWLCSYLNYGSVSMGIAPAAKHENCHCFADKGKNINMISLNTGIAFEAFENLCYWNHKHAYHPRYVMNNLIVWQIFGNQRLYRWWLTLLLILFWSMWRKLETP